MPDLVLVHIRLTRDLRDWLVAEAERRTRAEGHFISVNAVIGEAVMGLRKKTMGLHSDRPRATIKVRDK